MQDPVNKTYKTTVFAECKHRPCSSQLRDKGLAHRLLTEISEASFPSSPVQETVGEAHVFPTDLLFHAEEAASAPARILL